jgi:hypothetical protein
VGREAPSSGYTDGGVNLPLFHTQCALINYKPTLIGEALEI